MNANATRLVSCRTHGWRMGFANMLAKENTAWWRTRRWWIQGLLWLILLNIGSATSLRMGMTDSFLYVAGLVLPIAAIVLSQDAILGERHSGTAAWVFSKPLRRPAFLLAKIISYGLGFLVTGILLPGGIACLKIIARGGSRSFLPGFVGSLGLVYLNLVFYLTLALMLATLFHGRGPVMGITLLSYSLISSLTAPGWRNSCRGGLRLAPVMDPCQPFMGTCYPASRCPQWPRSSQQRCGACCSPAWPSGAFARRSSSYQSPGSFWRILI
jgi:hypothetical protein